MTIEAKLDETNRLLTEMIAVIKSRDVSAPAAAQAATPAKRTAKPAAEKPVEPKVEKPADPAPVVDEGPSLFDEEPVVEEKPLTKDDIRNALMAYQLSTDKAKTLELLKKHGAISLGTLAADKAPALVAEVKAALGAKFDETVQKAIAAAKK
jgi:hypothetical protein